MASSLDTNSHRISQLFERERDVENSVITNNPYPARYKRASTGHGGMEMPDNSNPKLKHALFFHHNKNQAPPVHAKAGRQNPLAYRNTTYLRGRNKETLLSWTIFGERRKRRRRRNAIGAKERRTEPPSFARNADAEYLLGKAMYDWLQEYVIGQRYVNHDILWVPSGYHQKIIIIKVGILTCPSSIACFWPNTYLYLHDMCFILSDSICHGSATSSFRNHLWSA